MQKSRSGTMEPHQLLPGRPRQTQVTDRADAGLQVEEDRLSTLKGFEVMHALQKGQAALWQYGGGIMGEVRLIEGDFGVYTA